MTTSGPGGFDWNAYGFYAGAEEVQRHLADVDYPCTKQDLIDYARLRNAPDHVIIALCDIENRAYDGPTDLSEAIDEVR